MPAGVVNIVTGLGLPAGDAIARHPNIKRLAFTGSVPTGRAIQRAAAEGGIKHVTLELGGKNPLIAFPDMDPDTVARIAVAGMNFAWQGQSCGSTSRLMLHESLHKPVLERVVDRVSKLRLGDPLDGLASGVGQHGVEDLAHAQNFAGVDIDIRRLPGQALHGGLVNHDTAVRERKTFALRSSSQKQRSHTCGHP